jgi:acetoin utilization deacetylase AcuC-like enzyme
MQARLTATGRAALAGMRRIGHTLSALGHPLLIVQESGYSVRNLRLGANAFFHGLAEAWYGR